MAVRRRQREFKDLVVWQKAHRLTLEAYRATSTFPNEELFGITSQIRRSASSVPANIAEGCGRGGRDLAPSCVIAAGSTSELEYRLVLAHDLGYLDLPTYDRLSRQVEEVERMLGGFLDSLESPA